MRGFCIWLCDFGLLLVLVLFYGVVGCVVVSYFCVLVLIVLI